MPETFSPLIPLGALRRPTAPVTPIRHRGAKAEVREPRPETVARLRRYAQHYAQKMGITTHPDREVTEAVLLGLAHHVESLGRPLCPCRFYADPAAELRENQWICACDDMRQYKYCHCLLFTNEEGLPITEHLPDDHDGRSTYGLVKDPHPELGRHRPR